jgi:hypothetical protein
VSILLTASAYPVECRSIVDVYRKRQPSNLASPLNYASNAPRAEGVATLILATSSETARERTRVKKRRE